MISFCIDELTENLIPKVIKNLRILGYRRRMNFRFFKEKKNISGKRKCKSKFGISQSLLNKSKLKYICKSGNLALLINFVS